MYRSLDNIQEAIKLCLKELRDIALEDQIITEDEQAIITKIEYDFNNLETQVVQVLESDLSEDEFQDLIADFLEDVVENVTLVAMADNHITEDEEKLIDRIRKFVEGMRP